MLLSMQLIQLNWCYMMWWVTRLHWSTYRVHNRWWFMSCNVTSIQFYVNWTKYIQEWLSMDKFFARIFEWWQHTLLVRSMKIYRRCSNKKKSSKSILSAFVVLQRPWLIRFYMVNVNGNSFYCRQIGKNGLC